MGKIKWQLLGITIILAEIALELRRMTGDIDEVSLLIIGAGVLLALYGMVNDITYRP